MTQILTVVPCQRIFDQDGARVCDTATNALATAARLLQVDASALERALTIMERTHGSDHVQVALTVGSLGMAYGALGDAAEKWKCISRAVEIFERAHGPDHPHAKFYRAQLEVM